MINAKDLSVESLLSDYAEAYLKSNVERCVKAAAKEGHRHTEIYFDDIELSKNIEEVLTPERKAIIRKLVEKGYSTELVFIGEAFTPIDSIEIDDDEDECDEPILSPDLSGKPKHRHVFLNISW
jgi:hypothetical protein